MASTLLETFLASKKITTNQLIAVSSSLEKLRTEDRAIKRARRLKTTAKENEKEKYQLLASKKPRSGKPITQTTLHKLMVGTWVSGPTRTRVLRATNTILERRKQEKVQLSALFDLSVPRPKSKTKEKEKDKVKKKK